MTDASPDSLLGYTLNLGGLARRRLERVLGGGATAVVFLGVSPDAPEDTSRHVAVKVARPDPQWREALVTEWRNLTRLERAEQPTQTHYFPRVLWPPTEQEMEIELYMRPPGLDWGFYKWVILVQELVRGEGVHDLLLDYPGLRLPEPLGLAIAEQYVEMLRILHGADLTCADRKLADLRWTKAYALQPGDQADLDRFRRGEPPGQLMVLDWNVSARADSAYVALDLFHFGTLWHRMLLKSEPRFGKEWRLEEPLDRHPLWPTLSAGTQAILSRLFHPQPEKRYRDANALLKDIRDQRDLWRQQPDALWQIARSDGESPERRWAAVDLLAKLTESWGARRTDFPDFDRVSRSVRHALERKPFQPLQEAFDRREWGTAQDEVERLAKAYAGEPTRLLLIERYRQIVHAAQLAGATFPALSSLWNNYVPELDELGANQRKDLKQWKDNAGDGHWREALTQLWAEAEYYPTLAAARDLRQRGDIRGAEAGFRDAFAYRQILKTRPQVIEWLDDLLGNPEAEAQAVAEQAEQLRRASDLLRAALIALVNGTDFEAAKQRLDAAVRAAPGEALLGRAYRLLMAEEAWRRAEDSTALSVQMLHLARWRDALNALMAASPAGHAGLTEAEWEGIKQGVGGELGRLLDERQTAVRTHVLTLAKPPGPVPNADRPVAVAGDGANTAESLRLLIGMYREVFPDDRALREGLRRVLADCETAIRQTLSSVSGPLRGPRHAEERYRVWHEVLPWVYHGKRLAEIAGEPWPDDLSPEAVEKQTTEARGCLAAVQTWLGRYLQAA